LVLAGFDASPKLWRRPANPLLNRDFNWGSTGFNRHIEIQLEPILQGFLVSFYFVAMQVSLEPHHFNAVSTKISTASP
jgi:hypothetical protein